MNHMAKTIHFPDPVAQPEITTWCGSSAATIQAEDRVVLEAWINQCEACSDARLDELHVTKSSLLAKTEATKLGAPDQPTGCNRHDDCEAAEDQAALDGKPERFGAGSVRLAHCHDETCEDCRGS